VTIFDAIGCSTQLQIPVNINAAPIASIIVSQKEACAPACFTYSCVTNATGTNVSFAWNLDDGTSFVSGANPVACYNAARSYTPSVKVTDANGCANTGTNAVTVHPVPQADFLFTPDKPSLYENVVEFKDISTGATISNYSWFVAGINSNSNTPNMTHTFDNIGNYLVTLLVTSDFGCSDTTFKLIKVEDEYALYIPNAFTPNEDGKNDIFQPKGSGFTKYELAIFDRWGKRVFESNELEKGWDGTIKGQIAPDGVYAYKITLITIGGKAKDLTGSVTLLK
jgi:gliding motility-associated-like protein